MTNSMYIEHVNANDFHNTKVTVDDLVEFFNNASKFDAKLLKNKDRVAIFDRSTKKKCAEFAYRNKKDSFSCALQCNKFDANTIERVANTVHATYKYHSCKNQRDYVTVNDVSAESAMSFVFRVFDKLVK